VRESVTIHRATGNRPTTVGDDNFLMACCHMGHDGVVGNGCMLANSSMMGGHVELSDQVILGGNGTIHQFCRLGRLSMLSGMAGISGDIPPFCTVYRNHHVGSLNLVGLRRAGLRSHIAALKAAFDITFRGALSNESASDRIRAELGDDPLCCEFADFLRFSKRGLCKYTERVRDA